MRPISYIVGLVLLLVVASPSPALAKGSATARMTACATAQTQAARFLVAEGSMKALRGASRMQMRFELQGRTAERRGWHGLSAPGFGVWSTADATARRYVYQKRVEALTAPGAYRMVVQFRWMNGSRQVAAQRRVTRVCRQPDLRPDLVPRDLAVVIKQIGEKAPAAAAPAVEAKAEAPAEAKVEETAPSPEASSAEKAPESEAAEAQAAEEPVGESAPEAKAEPTSTEGVPASEEPANEAPAAEEKAE